MMKGTTPKLVVITPVRNEAWVLRAYLAATSLWADVIIIADQMSTDGSRDIYREFGDEAIRRKAQGEHCCELIVIDNDRKEMHMAATRRLLFETAKKCIAESGRPNEDFILFALDADEFLTGDFMETESWQHILNSQPNDVFCFRWKNIMPDKKRYFYGVHMPWVIHASSNLWDGMFPDNVIHEWRLPWPPDTKKEQEYNVDDICFLHFCEVPVKRVFNKHLFYQISTVAKVKNVNILKHWRQYHSISYNPTEYYELQQDDFSLYEKNNVRLFELVNNQEEGKHLVEEARAYIDRFGSKKFGILDIWTPEVCQLYGVKDPRSWRQKVIHGYCRLTQPYQKSLLVRAFDKCLKIWI